MECKAECAGLARIEEKVDILMGDMYNHGQDGLKTKLLKFMERQDAIREERERNDKSFRFWLTTVLAIMSIMLAVIGILETNRQIRSGMLKTPKIITSTDPGRVYAGNRNLETTTGEAYDHVVMDKEYTWQAKNR